MPHPILQDSGPRAPAAPHTVPGFDHPLPGEGPAGVIDKPVAGCQCGLRHAEHIRSSRHPGVRVANSRGWLQGTHEHIRMAAAPECPQALEAFFMSEHNRYFQIDTTTPGTVPVLFLPPRAHPKFSPQILTSGELQQEPMEGMHVSLEGKSAVWIYAHAAYTAVRRGAARISVRQPQEADPIVVHPLPDCIPGGAAGRQDDRWYDVQAGGEGHYELRFKDCESNFWPVAVLETHPVELPAGDIASLVLGGRGSTWMYAAAGVAAARRGIRPLLCDIPHEPGLVSIGEMTPGCHVPRKKIRSTPGLVVGIVGDPNTGKSVFAHILELILRRQYPDSWLYDCDAASPTPNWYLTMLQRGRDVEGKALRKRQKREWTDSLEQDVAASLQSLKTSLEVVLADLPGGNHSLPEPQRIPKGRETILREVDLFILLGREDKPDSIRRWREDLALHGLDGRIMAELWTRDPGGELNWALSTQDGLVRGVLSGLDRGKDAAKGAMALSTQASEILCRLSPPTGVRGQRSQ